MYFQCMNFDEIPIRMLKLGVDRAWLAEQCDYTAGSLARILAPNGDPKAKTDKALRRIWEALDREEQRQKRPLAPESICQIVVRPSVDKFTEWNKAALNEKITIEQWAIQALNKAAESGGYTIPDAPSIVPIRCAYEMPLLRAAAGSPILADAETIEIDQDPGTGRFMLELRGDSMAPRFADRQRIILRDKNTLKRPVLKYGEFYLFVHQGQSTFKQWAKDSKGNKVLRPLNPKHEDILADDTTDWIGWYDAADNA